jgi:hypothetical protein
VPELNEPHPPHAPTVAPAVPPLPAVRPASRLRGGRGRRFATVAVAVAALGAASGFLLLHHGTKTVTGSLALSDDSLGGYSVDQACTGGDGYSDIRGGAQAVLTDGDHTTIATADLGEGRFDGAACVFDLTFHDVPKTAFYALQIGNTARGDLQYPYDQLVRDHWSLRVSLGS